MRVRFKNEKELRTYGLIIDSSDQNRALPAKLAEQCPSIGQSRTLDQLVAAGKEQWADIQKNEKYLTGRYWDFAGTLQEIKNACGKDIHAWAAAYRAIGIDRRRASELLLYRQAFKSRQEAAGCPVLEANRLIRQSHHEIGEADEEETIDAVNVPQLPVEQGQKQTADSGDEHDRNVSKQTLSFQCSKSMQWLRTPPEIWAALQEEFAFTVDVCASDDNHLLPRFYTEADDGLAQDWTDEVVYCHPLFDGNIGRWVEKAFSSKCQTVLLLPSATHTRYFHRYIYRNPRCEVRFLEKPNGGFRFGKDDGSPDDPARVGYVKGLMVVIFRNAESITLPAMENEEYLGQNSIRQTGARPTLDQVKCAVAMLSDREVDALHAFTVDLIRCRVSKGTAIACLPAPRLEYETADAQGSVVWEEV